MDIERTGWNKHSLMFYGVRVVGEFPYFFIEKSFINVLQGRSEVAERPCMTFQGRSATSERTCMIFQKKKIVKKRLY